MRLILEKNEIVAILGKHFEVELDPEKVIIRTDPLEIEVSGIPMTEAVTREDTNVVMLSSKNQKHAVARVDETNLIYKRADPDATIDPPEPGNDGLGGGTSDLHPAAVLAASKALEQQLEKESALIKRRAGSGSHTAPARFEDEI